MTVAITAASFISTLGVNTHLDFDGTYADLAQVEANLEYLGVENVRDSAEVASDVQTWLQVAQATGVKFDVYIAETSQAGMQTDISYMTALANEGVLNDIEGGDEEDDAYPQSLGNTLAATAQVQQQLYMLGQQLDLPIINMSFGAGWTPANHWQGDYGSVGNLAAYADYANAHTYPTATQTPNEAIGALNSDAELAANGRPVMTTEIGWNTSSVSETAAAQYTVDATFDGIADGDTGMYFYALYDDSSGAYGMFNSDGTPRPAATALHDLTTLLADPGAASFTPGSLNYTLAGTQSTDNSILIEKSNGSFWIGLWDEGGTTHTVTVNLPSAASEVEVYDVVTGTTAIETASNASSIQVSLGADPLLIEVIPTTGTSTGTTGAGTGTSPPPTSGPTDLAVNLPAALAVAVGSATQIQGISISDAWAASNPGTMVVNVWDDALDGTVSAPGYAAATSISLTGTEAQINTVLASLTFNATSAGSDGTTVDAWNQAGVEVTKTLAVTVAAAPPPPASDTITIAASNADPVELVSNAAISATAGDHMLFIGGTGNTVTLTGGTETVQAFEGGNTITTGAGNDMIQMAGSGNVVNAGAGQNTIEDSGSSNTIALPATGNDTVYGYVLQNNDMLDLRSALASTSWNGTEGTLGNYLSVATVDNNAVITLHPTGGSAGSAIATLEGSGQVTMASLLQHAIP